VPEPVQLTITDGVAVVEIDNPPVNALSNAVRAGMKAALEQAAADPAVQAIVVAAAGRTFIAGADIPSRASRPCRRSRRRSAP
jgi:3-hydroxyacyl-CoA dehydrogenase